MNEEIENESVDTNSGGSEGASSDASSSESSGSAANAAASEQKQTETSQPFHEHPRFKELVEQKNEYSRKYQDIEARYKAMETQFKSFQDTQPKPPTEADALLKDLKGIDPRLANYLQETAKRAELAEKLQARLDNMEKSSQEERTQQVVQAAVSRINGMHEQNKVSDFGKQFINNQLDIAYRSGRLQASDAKAIEAAYTEAHSAIKAYEDGLKRTHAASYAQEKKKDAAVPSSQPKGAPAKPGQKPLNAPKDKEALRAEVVKTFAIEQAARRAATNA